MIDLNNFEIYDKASKNDSDRNIYRKIFKILCAGEIIMNNSVFNGMAMEIMEILFKINLDNIDPLLGNYYDLIMTIDKDNFVPFETNMTK